MHGGGLRPWPELLERPGFFISQWGLKFRFISEILWNSEKTGAQHRPGQPKVRPSRDLELGW